MPVSGGNVSLVDPSNSSRLAEFDTTFRIPIFIALEHHEIHEGDSYIVDVKVTAASLDLAFKIPSGTKRMHSVFQWAAESKAHFELCEGRTWNAGTGSTGTIFNRDRNNPNISQVQGDAGGSFVANMSVVQDPTGQTGGTVIHDEYSWSDKKQTVRSRDIAEFILKNDETYVAKLTSDDGSKGLHVALHWYEHTDS